MPGNLVQFLEQNDVQPVTMVLWCILFRFFFVYIHLYMSTKKKYLVQPKNKRANRTTQLSLAQI